MLGTILENASAIENLSIIGFLAFSLGGAWWIIKFLYDEKSQCEKSQLENAIAIGELSGDVKALKSRVELQTEYLDKNEKRMTAMQLEALKLVAKNSAEGLG